MAQIIKTDGQIVPVEPKNGTDFQLDELQQIVGGYVQLFPLANEAGEVMVMNEDGNEPQGYGTGRKEAFPRRLHCR